jgi:hypothetical protein
MTIDVDLELVRELHPEGPGISSQARPRARAALLGEIEGEVGSRRQPLQRRFRLPLLPSLGLPPGASRRRVALSGAVVGTLVAGLLAAGALLPAGETRDSELGATPASAAIVLDRAANTAMSRAAVYPTARQYGYLKVETGSTSSAGQTSNAGRQIFGDRRIHPVQRELGDGGVPAGAQDDPDALAVVAEPELLVDCVQVEVHSDTNAGWNSPIFSSMITNRRREWW